MQECEGFIKDADCTKDTPLMYGELDIPIYGTGKRIIPRVEGRRDSSHFEKIFLPELLPLEEYDLVAILLSGGKDSIACYYKLLELGVPKERMEFWHHDIDGGNPERKMDWKCTQNYVKSLPIRTVSEYIRPTLLRRTRSSLRVKTQRVVTQEAITHSLHRRHSRGMMDLCLQETTASYRLYRRAKDETVHIEQKDIQGC